IASVISEVAFTGFAAGVAHTIETTGISTNGDPVLHLLTGPPSAWAQVAMDDNGAGGKAARLTFTPSAGINYWVLVRASGNDSSGTCALTVDGRPWTTGVAFGGFFATLEDVRAMETINTVRMPHGGGPFHVLYNLRADGAIQSRHMFGGIAGGVG